MIDLANFQQLLLQLNFNQNGAIFTKNFSHCSLSVDIIKGELIYPTDLKTNAHACNFSQNENFVVFECVHRLLEKGYNPTHIELEHKYPVGHGASGGRADILVCDNTNNPILIIECKTAGKELDKAWNKMQLNGGQLFSYAQQQRSVKFICLYASDFKNSQLSFENYVVTLNDIQNEVEKDNDKEIKRLFYKDAQDVKQLYQVWKETYALDFKQNGIFEDDVQAYNIGKYKLTLTDLKLISDKEMQAKYNDFAEILRKYNVSSKESAFDKLINLFLCKIVDEKNNNNDINDVEAKKNKELQFYWKGEYFDDYFDLIDRLQKLYADGMGKFLGEKITHIDNQRIIDSFYYFKNDKNATKDTVLKLFKQQKYFTNSDFGFIDVHNDKLFYQNAKILLDVVLMWQNYRLTGDNQNQFLGDMFEFFLDKGFKQSEGQFFTPIPICKFIIQSLPLKQLIVNNEDPPRVIDYACGSGHFLTEYASQVKYYIDATNLSELKKYYQAVFGVEKEYRLSKVAKISAFMYGQDDINIIYCDALSDIQQEISGRIVLAQEETFDILVANPPFAVEGFLTTLPQKNRENYTLFNKDIDMTTQNNIQCFFIERAAQLLKPKGIAAIIVPSSVLSNSDATHVGSREILLKHFDIIALVELGSGTFGKTGTNTVILFLRRKFRVPTEAEQYKNRVNDWFNPTHQGDEVYEDEYLIKHYCRHIGIAIEHYESLLKGGYPSDELLAHELFVDYHAYFIKSSDIVKLKEQKAFKLKTEAEREVELNKRFLSYILSIEKDKLYYFVLAFLNPQKVLVIKSPSDNKEQKAFLGYSWSDRKGAEGIQLIKDAQGNHLTPMYDPVNAENCEKISYLIAQNFLNQGDDSDLNLADLTDLNLLGLKDLVGFVNYELLIHLLDFSRKDFNKAISLTAKKSVETDVVSKWDLVKLGDICEIKKGKSITEKDTKEGNIKVVAGGLNFAYLHNESNRPENTITISASGANAGFINFWKEPIFASDCTTIIAKTNILNYYVFNFLKCIQNEVFNLARGAAQPHVYPDDIKALKIPLPPLNIQQEIVTECELIDKAVEEAEKVINDTQKEINEKINACFNAGFEMKKLGDIAQIKNGGTPDTKNSDYWHNGTIYWATLVDTKNKYLYRTQRKITQEGLKNSSAVLLPINTIIFSSRATIGEVCIAKVETCTNQGYKSFICDEVIIHYEYLYYILKFSAKDIESLAVGMTYKEINAENIKNYKVPVPDLITQQSIVSEIEQLDIKIATAQLIVNESDAKKQAVLKKYL